MKILKIMLLAFVLYLFCIGVYAQETVDMVAKLGIKEDVEKLESLVARKVQKNTLLNQSGKLKQIHVFKLKICCDEKKITENEWLDYSFLNYLRPEYVRIKEKRFGFKKKYLHAYTYLVNADGYRLDVCIGGRFYSCASVMPKELLSVDKNGFIFFMSSLDSRKTGYKYVVVKDNHLYGFDDFSDCNTLIPWNTYIMSNDWE